MTPQDYIAHAREVLKFSEERIAKNRYAIEKGLFFGSHDAVVQNSAARAAEIDKQARTDAEVADSKARHGKAYTTQYAVEWCRAQGWTILNREGFDHRLKRRRDVFGGWDILATDGQRNILIQAFGPGEGPAHIRKMEQNGAREKAVRIEARMILLEFERGNKTPKITDLQSI